jgi:hypothetical protein
MRELTYVKNENICVIGYGIGRMFLCDFYDRFWDAVGKELSV